MARSSTLGTSSAAGPRQEDYRKPWGRRKTCRLPPGGRRLRLRAEPGVGHVGAAHGLERDEAIRRHRLQGRGPLHAERAADEPADEILLHLLGFLRRLRWSGERD